MPTLEYSVRLKLPHPMQKAFIRSAAKHKVIRAGRRSGKTTGVAILAIEQFLDGRRVLYATPTDEQSGKFWKEVTAALAEPIHAGVFRKNETERTIERVGTDQRIKAKTAWHADALRGDYADLLILDEYQLMAESTWEEVGAPMLLDRNGSVVFIYTPLSLHSRSISRARDPRHASKLFAKALLEMKDCAAAGVPLAWEAFHFTSKENPHISGEALKNISSDMSSIAYRQEILAEDLQDVPGALWTPKMIDQSRVGRHPQLSRVGIGVDPPGGQTECGIVVVGVGPCLCRGTKEVHTFVIDDLSLRGSPDQWSKVVVAGYHKHKADRVFVEKNFGGDMVISTIRTADPTISFKEVTASRGKAVRAEPVSALYEQGKVHHVGSFRELEEEMVSWIPEAPWSPNRLDALVWVISELMLRPQPCFEVPIGVGERPSYWRI